MADPLPLGTHALKPLRVDICRRARVPPTEQAISAGCNLEMSIEIEGSMKHSQDIDIRIGANEVGNSVMSVQKDSDVCFRMLLVPVTKLREIPKELGLGIDTFDYAYCCLGVILRNSNCKYPGARFRPLGSTLFPPRFNSALHFFVADGSARFRILKTAVNHAGERKFTKNLFVRGIVGLILDDASHLFFDERHSTATKNTARNYMREPGRDGRDDRPTQDLINVL